MTFSLTPAGDGGTITSHYTLNGGAASTYSGPVTVDAEGTTTVSYWSVDALSQAESPKSATIRIDSTEPHTTSNAKTLYYSSGTVTLSGTDAAGGSGFSHTHYRFHGGATMTGTSVKVTSTGNYVLEYWSEDNAGNVESFHTANFSVRVKTAVSITSNHTSVVSRHPVVFTGHVSTSLPRNNRVEVWVKKPGSSKWVKLSTRLSTSTHHWSYTFKTTIRGTWYFQARFAGTSKYAPSTSTLRRVRVR